MGQTLSATNITSKLLCLLRVYHDVLTPFYGCRENGAMVEVFYEQLNFEMLTESEAYGVSRTRAYAPISCLLPEVACDDKLNNSSSSTCLPILVVNLGFGAGYPSLHAASLCSSSWKQLT
ncbi:unnamed protein product [Strongylus vulgaris]|uniref:Uncharacterized protein n=1 Tax=Strongylus vulgaris TaxID=40348 RepID=A0A3P7JFU5_STRVU|nr:unnamed protein product [Strongylus vulgaris]